MAKIIELTPLQVHSLGRERQEIIALREIIGKLTLRLARAEYELQRVAKKRVGATGARPRPKGGKHGH